MITPQHATDIINYLYAAQAITVTENQHKAWADYINHAIPDFHPRDIEPAARLAIKRWSEHGRQWRIDVAQFVRAAQAIRHERLEPYGTNIPLPPGLPADQHLAFIEAFKQAIRGGATENQAKTYGLHVVDFVPTPGDLTGPPENLAALIAAPETTLKEIPR